MRKLAINVAVLAIGLFSAAPAFADPTPPAPPVPPTADAVPPPGAGAMPPVDASALAPGGGDPGTLVPPGAGALPPGATLVMLPPDAPPTEGENEEDDEVMLWW
jgi:hypothetical protein